MKISEFIEYLEAQQKEHGDIDVLCVTPGCATAWEAAAPTEDVCSIRRTTAVYSKYHHVNGIEFLFIGADGEE
jgi:hypothetical protein